MKIKINGEFIEVPLEGVSKISDLLELLRAYIDPEHIVVAVSLNGRELTDSEWNKAPASFADGSLELKSDLVDNYIKGRISEAPNVVQACFIQFRDARKTFQQGDSTKANQKLTVAVGTLKAFFEWYDTIMQLVDEPKRTSLNVEKFTTKITTACTKICDQQLHQAWWETAQTIEDSLEPALDELETFCRSIKI